MKAGEGTGDEKVEHKTFLGQFKYSVWYYDDEYLSLYICQNPHNA